MKKLFLFFCSFLFCFANSQTNYVFNVELSSYIDAPSFSSDKAVLTYNGKDEAESLFFSKYHITNFYQTYPHYSGNLLNYFTFHTTNQTLMDDLKKDFPTKYIKTENLTGMQVQLVSYPNDYGITSPVSNLGANLNLKSFDYIGVPKAWNYFPNAKGDITIGISDGKVNDSDADFNGKVSYLYESSFNTILSCSSDSQHGTSVGAIAAAQGDNSHGMTGVCYDCSILNVPYTIDWYNPNFDGLMEMALLGVKVINMSWIQGYHTNDSTYISGYIGSQQEAINQLYQMGVVLVAGAGNMNSYTNYLAPLYMVYCYPASYDHVISVTLVNAKNANLFDEVTLESQGHVSWYNEDLISPTGSYENGTYSSYWEGTTTNSRVDICGPGFAPLYPNYLLGCLDSNGNFSPYGNATSVSTPYVTGTVALMQSLNPCLNPDEVEDVLQLSSKNIEVNPYNSSFIGRIGSGKLETGDSVEFVDEMMKSNGNALIDGQDFWRFDFDLHNINNKLTISNQTFRDGNTSNFVAKNEIDVTENSDFRPNSNGFVDLKIDSGITTCSTTSLVEKQIHDKNENFKKASTSSIKLYPNPNKGNFSIKIDGYVVKDLNVTIYDQFGRSIFNIITNESVLEFDQQNLPAGMYIVKLSSNAINQSLKFIKK